MPLRLAMPKFRKTGEPGDAPAPKAARDAEDDKATMRKRRVIRLTAIVFVALAAGQYMQSSKTYGGANAAGTNSRAPSSMNLGLGTAPRAMLVPVSLVATAGTPLVSAGVAGVGNAGILTISTFPEAAVMLPKLPVQVAAPACGQSLGVTALPGAMLGLSLTVPCHAGERVVLRHAGLAVTGKMDAAGGLQVRLPALDSAGAVAVEFADGTEAQGAAGVPELTGMRRLAVQWQAGDAFALHGLEGGAELEEAGDISADHPGPQDGAAKSGWLVSLGDASVEAPLLAQVYTYPAEFALQTDVAILAPVGPETCGHDMLGQTLTSAAGAVRVTDLTLSMPACDGKTGYLVLKNLFPDMKIAASN